MVAPAPSQFQIPRGIAFHPKTQSLDQTARGFILRLNIGFETVQVVPAKDLGNHRAQPARHVAPSVVRNEGVITEVCRLKHSLDDLIDVHDPGKFIARSHYPKRESRRVLEPPEILAESFCSRRRCGPSAFPVELVTPLYGRKKFVYPFSRWFDQSASVSQGPMSAWVLRIRLPCDRLFDRHRTRWIGWLRRAFQPAIVDQLPARCAAVRQARAWAVSVGLRAPLVPMTDAPRMPRLGASCENPH